MKVEIREVEKVDSFKPFKLVVDIETIGEFFNLLGRLNLNFYYVFGKTPFDNEFNRKLALLAEEGEKDKTMKLFSPLFDIYNKEYKNIKG